MAEPKRLITPKQRAQNAAFRAACGRASLPAGFRMAKAAGASRGDRSGFGNMIGQITGSLLDEQEMMRHGQWRFEALLGKSFDIKSEGGVSGEKTAVCAICFDKPLGDPALPCAHAFGCVDCAAFLIGQPCPICRVSIDAVGKPADNGPIYGQGVILPDDDKWVVFRAPSAGGKRSAAWKNGLRDDIVLFRTKEEMATVFEEIDEFTAQTTLIEIAGKAPSLFWSAADFLLDSPGPIDEAMLSLFREFANLPESQAKKAKAE